MVMKKVALNTLKIDKDYILSTIEKKNIVGGWVDPSYCGNMILCDCTYNSDGSIATYNCCPSHQLDRQCMY